MQQEKWPTVYSTSRADEASLVKYRLNAAGVDFIARNDIVSGILPFNGMGEVFFDVRPEDLERAREALSLPGRPAEGGPD